MNFAEFPPFFPPDPMEACRAGLMPFDRAWEESRQLGNMAVRLRFGCRLLAMGENDQYLAKASELFASYGVPPADWIAAEIERHRADLAGIAQRMKAARPAGKANYCRSCNIRRNLHHGPKCVICLSDLEIWS